MPEKLPYFPFYAGDWLSDEKLRTCSLAARGLWMDMLSLMHKNDRRGYLQVNGKPMTADQLARVAGCSTDDASRLLAELSDAGVFSATLDGLIFSRRMTYDEQLRTVRSQAGRKGAEVTNGLLPRQNGRQKSGKMVGKSPAPPPASESESESEKTRGSIEPLAEAENEPDPTPKKPRTPDPIWDALCAFFRLEPVTRSDKTRVGRIVRDLKLKSATPEEISRRGERYRVKWPNAALTPEALLKHWDAFAENGSAGNTAEAERSRLEREDSQRRINEIRELQERMHHEDNGSDDTPP